jgi:hypothetical protein
MWTVPTNASRGTACCVARVCDGALAETNNFNKNFRITSGRRRAVRGGPRRPLARKGLKSVAPSDGSSQGRKAH